MTKRVFCVKLQKEGDSLKFPPVPGVMGKRLQENISQEAWQLWITHQTMLVNENRLNLADTRARQYLMRQMEQFFFGNGGDQVAGFVPQDN
jgi:Fe-S cluster biosynthesis and repair protein YggX